MTFTKTFFEIGVMVCTLLTALLAVLMVTLPIRYVPGLAYYIIWPYLIFGCVTYLCGRRLEITAKYYVVYFAASSLIVGVILFLFGFFTALVKNPTEGLENASDHYIIALVGLVLVGFSWLAKKLTKTSCIPVVKELFRFIYY
ncbi:MAG: hypothetical protein WCT08_02060 [Patescibacteria group bacterium]